jgi:hypothetical protein
MELDKIGGEKLREEKKFGCVDTRFELIWMIQVHHKCQKEKCIY